MNIILFGPPGAGKGTQAKYLVKKLNGHQISTGDILRDEIKKDTDIGKKIINNMNEGKFVSDDIVNSLLKDHVFDPNKNLPIDPFPNPLVPGIPNLLTPYSAAAPKAALPSGLLTIFLIGLVIFFTRLPRPYNCLGSCILDIVIVVIKLKIRQAKYLNYHITWFLETNQEMA